MRAGRLRHKVTIEEKVATYNDYNEPIYTWQTFAEVFGGVEPLRGREYWAADQKQAEETTRIVIRYVSGIDPTMRVNFCGRIYNIEAIINPDERNRHLELMCKEAVT